MCKNLRVRNTSFDALKFFAIFLVVWGHSIQYLNAIDCIEEPVYRIIYSFHMPLFMMISGYFAVGSMNMNFSELILKKCRQILLPCFAWITLVWACLNVIELLKGNPILFIKLYWGYINQFWFLKSLFICYLLAFLGYKGGKLGILLAVLISQFISYSSVNFMFPAFVIGLFLRKKNIMNSTKLGYRYIVYVLFVAMLVLLCGSLWDIKLLTSQLIFSSDSEYTILYVYKMIVGLLGGMTFMMLFVVDFKNNKTFKVIAKYGQLTLGIYILQSLILERLIGRIICFDMASFPFIYVISPIISISVIGVCVWIINAIKSSKSLALAFLGERM